ncbi:MAG: hypothetical protein ACK50J_27555, partial [Planctomyces sp.]
IHDGSRKRWQTAARQQQAAAAGTRIGYDRAHPSYWEPAGPEQSAWCTAIRRAAVCCIMETFPIVKRKDIKHTTITDENGQFTHPGTNITKDTTLSIYDAMTESIRTGVLYQARLDPPSGPPIDSNGNFIPMAQWDKSNWPQHIHAARATEIQT